MTLLCKCPFRYGKTGNKNHASCLATLLQNEFNSDVARFTSHIKPVLHQIRLLTVFNVSDKTCNIAFQLILQQCCKTSCTFFVARFTEVLVVSLIMLLTKYLFAKRRILFYSFFLVLYLLIDGSDSLFMYSLSRFSQ